MSLHNELMADYGVPALMRQYGDPAVTIIPAEGNPFPWEAAIGPERGGEDINSSGDVEKVLRRNALGPTQDLLAYGITELQRRMKVNIEGVIYSIDLRESHWGATVVNLGLRRKPVVEHEQLENNAAFRQ